MRKRIRTGSALKPGKVPLCLLQDQLSAFGVAGRGVIIGPAVGEDAAVIEVSTGHLLVATADPITMADKDLGWYLVQVNANDIAVMGAQPRWLLVTLLLPEGRVASQRYSVMMGEIREACAQLGIAVVGGHSEVTIGLDRPIALGCLLGEVKKSNLFDKRRIRPGDLLFMTRFVAIEGTAVLAKDFHTQLRSRGFGVAFLRRAQRLLYDPGISIVKEARFAARQKGVRAMHDPTEGGILTAAVEMALPADIGLELDCDSIPILPETRRICGEIGLDPLALLASGSLLVATSPRFGTQLTNAFKKARLSIELIGRFIPKTQGLWITRSGRKEELVVPKRDELARAFELL